LPNLAEYADVRLRDHPAIDIEKAEDFKKDIGLRE